MARSTARQSGRRRHAVIGAVLAGGAGRRIGGDKPLRMLAGRTLLEYPVAALGEVCERVVVLAKPQTRLPALGAIERWDEPSEPRHPLTGLVHGLERAQGPLLVCAVDMPFVTAAACARLVRSASPDARACLAEGGGRLEPAFGVYRPAALELLRRACEDIPLTKAVEALCPQRVALPRAITRSVNTLEELVDAEAELSGR